MPVRRRSLQGRKSSHAAGDLRLYSEEGPRSYARPVTENTVQASHSRPHHWSVVVGTVRGIELRVHVSFLLLVVLFAAAAPEPGISSALTNVGWLVAIFACVVVHELAHCFMARRRGAQVDEILLFPLGGVSRLRNLPESPGDEFAIAIVGPLTSIGLGVLAAALCLATGASLLPIDPVAGPWLARLAWLNLILGVFNLLPAFPLDGGRVLRALLERNRDLETATRLATRVGHLLAGTLIVVGFLFDVWLMLIGVFVYFGASAEEAGTIVHARLRGHRVREVMHAGAMNEGKSGDVIDADALLDDEVVTLVQGAPGHRVAVAEGGEVVGTVSLEDILAFVSVNDRRSQAAP